VQRELPALQLDDVAGVRRMYAMLQQGTAGYAPDAEGKVVY
jgi:hypothetical protein